MALRGVLFDKDGTLIDFNASWRAAFETVALELAGEAELAKALLEEGGWDEASQTFRGGSLIAAGNSADIAEAWTARLERKQDPQALAGWMDRRFAEMGALHAAPLFPVDRLFVTLRDMGLKVGVATNDSEAGARASLGAIGALALADFVAGYDSGHGPKPELGMIEAFCRDAGLAAGEVVMVGDNAHDMIMGQAAGAGLLVGVLSGNSGPEALQPPAHHLLASAEELPGLLSSLS
jgi:phosphoglycolate phosphatase